MIRVRGEMSRDTLLPYMKRAKILMGTNVRAGAMRGARMLNANIREFTPVDTGETIAGIGEFDPTYINDSARSGAEDRARAAAIFEVLGSRPHQLRTKYVVTVGTRSKVAFWINYGFFPRGGETFVNGQFMFERGMAKTERDFKPLLRDVLESTFRLRDMSKAEFMEGHRKSLANARRELTRRTRRATNR